jgi:hypothetical protein
MLETTFETTLSIIGFPVETVETTFQEREREKYIAK